MPTGHTEPGEPLPTPPGTPPLGIPWLGAPPAPTPPALLNATHLPPTPGLEALEQHPWVPPCCRAAPPPSGAHRGLGPAGGGDTDPHMLRKDGPPPPGLIWTSAIHPSPGRAGWALGASTPPASGSSLPWGGHTPPKTPHSPQGPAPPPGGPWLELFSHHTGPKPAPSQEGGGGPCCRGGECVWGGHMPTVGGTGPGTATPPRSPGWLCQGAAGPPPRHTLPPRFAPAPPPQPASVSPPPLPMSASGCTGTRWGGCSPTAWQRPGHARCCVGAQQLKLGCSNTGMFHHGDAPGAARGQRG